MNCIVLRPFDGPKGKFQAGDVVDISEWRQENVQSLIDRRFLRIESLPVPIARGHAVRTAKAGLTNQVEGITVAMVDRARKEPMKEEKQKNVASGK